MATYKPQVLQRAADELYKRSGLVALAWIVAGMIVGFFSAQVFQFVERQQMSNFVHFLAVAMGLVVGLVIGEAKSFKYRVEAEKLLCQMQIEEHLRNVRFDLQRDLHSQSLGHPVSSAGGV